MIEKICNYLTERIRKKMPEINDERAEVINYGLQIIVGEIPKTFIILGIAWALGVLKLTIFTLILILPYRAVSGGVHLKTHLGCIICTSLFYTGTAFLSQIVVFEQIYLKYFIIVAIWLFSMIMIKMYAPADTEEVPILRKKERKIKKILSYIIMTLTLLVSLILNNSTISNILTFGVLVQTISITKLVYKLTNNKYGYEEYYKNQTIQDNA